MGFKRCFYSSLIMMMVTLFTVHLPLIGIGNRNNPKELEVGVVLTSSPLESPYSAAWEQLSSPINCPIYSADFLNAEDGWAVGEPCEKVPSFDGVLRWNGETWEVFELPGTPVGTLSAVKILSHDNAWIVGVFGSILHWDGQTWENVAGSEEYNLYSVTFLSPDLGWAFGGSARGLTPDDPKNYSVILQWDGVNWVRIQNPGRFLLHSIAMTSKDDGWAVGELGTFLHWDGKSWQNYQVPTQDESIIYKSIVFTSPNDGWVVGGDPLDDLGVLLHWDGREWIEFQRTEHWLVSIAMIDPNFGWVVGGNNIDLVGGSVILHWNGKTWDKYPTLIEIPLSFIWAKTRTDGWLFASGITSNSAVQGAAIFRYGIQPTPTDTVSGIPMPTATSVSTAPAIVQSETPRPIPSEVAFTPSTVVPIVNPVAGQTPWIVLIGLLALGGGIVLILLRRR